MRSLRSVLARLERRVQPERPPRLVVMEPGESREQCMRRLGISDGAIARDVAEGRKVLWIKWAG